MNALNVTINGRTFRPVVNDFVTVNGIAGGFRDATTRAATLDTVARVYGVDARRAFLIARSLMNRTERRRRLEVNIRIPARPSLPYDMPANDYRAPRD